MRMIMLLSAFLVVVSIASGCAGRAKGDTPADKRSAIQKMRRKTLADLYRIHPPAKQDIQNAYGYAVFSNVGINLLMVSTGQGFGVAHNNQTGKDIYMRMLSAGVGLGMGIKDFRGVFVFDNRNVFDRFVNHGWQASGQADAAGKMGDKGAAIAVAVELEPGLRLYQLTESGLAMQATVQGTKYWKDKELN